MIVRVTHIDIQLSWGSIFLLLKVQKQTCFTEISSLITGITSNVSLSSILIKLLNSNKHICFDSETSHQTKQGHETETSNKKKQNKITTPSVFSINGTR